MENINVRYREQNYLVVYDKGCFKVLLKLTDGGFCQMYHESNVIPVLKKALTMVKVNGVLK